MQHTLFRILFVLAVLFPAHAFAATEHSIHAEWQTYTAPSGYTLAGFNLYQEGGLVCQTNDAASTAMDCTVSLPADSASFTLTALFSDGTESPHSSPFTFTAPTDVIVEDTTTGSTTTIHAEWSTYTAPTGYTVAGFNLYQEGTLACQTQDASATSLDCTVSLVSATPSFTLTAAFSDGTESPHSAPFTFSPPVTDPIQAVIAADTTSGTAPVTVTFNGASSGGDVVSYLWNFGDGSNGSGVTLTHTYNTAGTHTATLTITGSGNQTSSASTTITVEAPIVITPPAAAVSSSVSSGTAPVAISFNGSASTATGNASIVSYSWNFGDGGTGSGANTTHTFTSAGAFQASLTVVDSNGLSNTASTTVNVAAPVVIQPPNAVVSSSSAAGPAPLAVSFDGSGSSADSGHSITSYAWSFGDGSTGSGATVSHSFTSAGTYATTLTVTDSNGQTDSTTTPIVVSAPVVVNKNPIAKLNCTPNSGALPLAVSCDGSASVDSDGTITAYIWDFGDGSTVSGVYATHTYEANATYTAKLTVTDNNGASASTSTTITVEEDLTTSLNLELGEVTVNHNWIRVPFNKVFQNPIVIVSPPTINDSAPCTIRVRNVTTTGFELRVNEWNYLDGTHGNETVSYVVAEKGRTVLPDGSIVEAGTFTGSTKFKTFTFAEPFNRIPVLLTTIVTVNEPDALSGRLKGITQQGFAYYFREQEKNTNAHAGETVHYIAWEAGKGTFGGIQYEVARTGNKVTSNWYTHPFQSTFTDAPMVFAGMQTCNGADTAALRLQKVSTANFIIKVEEEQSKDPETSHAEEDVGYLLISPFTPVSYTMWPGTATPATVDAGADGAQELGVKFRSDSSGYITGIRFYKSAANTGTHVGNLWTSTGELMATATFTNETESGWQQVDFPTPVPIAANTVYVASYFCQAGHHSVDRNYFENAGADSAPLHALAAGVAGGNGVYAYGASSVFPTSSYRSTNYWVDVVFQP